ncbi:MAG TPA: efflux RND transporter periplasmic adaptor subunit [Planctomycetota bacterium]|nr:efflux RND transporter periplasmic adaptor subunit [Planctomycetota bacterium]
MKKLIIFIVLVALVAAVGFQVYRKVSEKKTGRPMGRMTVVPVEVTPIEKVTVTDTRDFSGTLVAKSQFLLAPKVTGRLEKILVDIGDQVKRGQLVAELDDGEYTQQVEQARAEIEVVKASLEEAASSLEVAKRNFDRAAALREKQIMSEADLDAADSLYKASVSKQKVAVAQVSQKEAALKAAEVRLSYTRIHAAWDGGSDTRVIGERLVDQGAMLKANDPICSVLDVAELTALIFVSERDYSRLLAGQTVEVSADAYPGRTFPGTVSRIAPLIRETSREARVEVQMYNPDLVLKPGMFVNARIEFARHTDVPAVSMSTLVKRTGKQGVFIVKPGEHTASFVPVTLGIINGETAEVTEPELSGQVVTLGQHLLEDGSAVLLPGEKPAQPGPSTTAPGGEPDQPEPGPKPESSAAPASTGSGR